MKNAILIVRILMGAMLIVFGLNKFLQFMPMPSPVSGNGSVYGSLTCYGLYISTNRSY